MLGDLTMDVVSQEIAAMYDRSRRRQYVVAAEDVPWANYFRLVDSDRLSKLPTLTGTSVSFLALLTVPHVL